MKKWTTLILMAMLMLLVACSIDGQASLQEEVLSFINDCSNNYITCNQYKQDDIKEFKYQGMITELTYFAVRTPSGDFQIFWKSAGGFKWDTLSNLPHLRTIVN